MDNKKWYKRFGTLFWWFFAILPLVIALIYFIGYHLTFNSGIATASELASYHTNASGNYLTYLDNVCVDMSSWCPTFIITGFNGLFNAFDITSSTLSFICAWFIFSNVIHLLVDICVYIFHKMHNIIERE